MDLSQVYPWCSRVRLRVRFGVRVRVRTFAQNLFHIHFSKMALVNEVVDTETLIGFLLCFVIIKLSSIKTGAFNLPHKLLSGLLICIPSTESLNNLNESKQSFQKTKKKHKGAPIVRKHKTINDRVEALQYEVEPVESGMLMRYSCWEEYDSLVLFSLCCMIGFVVIEGWRLWEHQVRRCQRFSFLQLPLPSILSRPKFSPFSVTHRLFLAPSLLQRAIDPMQTGSCLESAQMRVKSAQAENSGHIYFGYFMSYVVLEAGRIPHTYMYDKVLNWALGLLVAFFFFMYMHTPALEKHMELPLSAVADDIAVRFALWNRLVDNSSMWPDYWAENGGVFVRVLMSLYVAYLVAGFGHSLGQLSKVTTYILNSKKGKMTPDKILVVMMASVPLLVTLTYFFNAELSNMTLFKAPPVVIRSILTLFWSFLYMLLVPRHLQFYMQQGFKDSVKELRAHHVNAEKVRMHFQKRVTLVVYSACQYCCFPLFVVTYLLYTGHKSGVGTLGHARPFTLGNFETGPELAPVVSRSTLYDAFQAAMKNSNLGVCDVLPEGSYSDEEEGYR